MKHIIILFFILSCSGNTEKTHPVSTDTEYKKNHELQVKKPEKNKNILTPEVIPTHKKIVAKKKPVIEKIKLLGKAPVTKLLRTFNSPVSSLSIDKNCSAIVAGGTSMDLYFHSISDKKNQNWVLDNVKNGCHRERCRKPVYASFFPDGKTILVALNGDTVRVVDRKKRVLGFRGGFLQESRGLAFGPESKSFAVLYENGLYIFRLPSGLLCKKVSYKASKIFSSGKTLFAQAEDKLDVLDFKLKNNGAVNIKNIHSVLKYKENLLVSNSEYFYLLNIGYKIVKKNKAPQDYEIIAVFENNGSSISLLKKNNTYYMGLLTSDLKISGVHEITGFSGEIKNFAFSSPCLAFSDGKSVYMWKNETEN